MIPTTKDGDDLFQKSGRMMMDGQIESLRGQDSSRLHMCNLGSCPDQSPWHRPIIDRHIIDGISA